MSIKVIREPAEAKVDIVFVHGWHGNQEPWTSTEKSVFWPEKLLSPKTPDARILSFEYESTISAFWDDDGINDISGDLIDELMDQRTESEKETRPIIFVAHCLGGLVTENVLVRASNHPRKKALAESTKAILLLGTPHFQPASLTATATKYFQLAEVPEEEIPNDSDMKDKSKKLVAVPQAFANLLDGGAQIEIESFYEGTATKLNGKGAKIVDESLAQSPNGPPPERLARTHQQLSQFESEDEKDYRKVSRILIQWVEKIAPPEKAGLVQNVSNATFSGAYNSGLQLGQNAGTLSGFSFGRA